MGFLRILAFVFIAVGFTMVFAARGIVDKYGLDKNIKCEFESELSQEELELYKNNKAVVNFKMLGMLVALPGMVMLIILFR